MKKLIIFLIIIAVIGIGVGISYPIRYKLELDSNNNELEDLSNMRRRVMEELQIEPGEEAGGEAEATAEPRAEATEPAGQPEMEPTRPPEAVEVTQPPEKAAQPAEAVTQPPEGATQPPAETAQPGEATQPPEAEATQIPEDVTQPHEAEATQPPEETVGQPSEEAATQPPEEAVTQPPEEVVTQPPETVTRPPEEAIQSPEATAAVEAVQVTAPPVTPTPGIMDLIINDVGNVTPTPLVTSTPRPTPSPTPSPRPDRDVRTRDEADSFKAKEKIKLDKEKILPELKDIYALNNDLVGWLYIEDTNVDYPVVQCDDGKYYLSHDFYGKSNANGQIILEDKCDPYTPSYNLVISGHHMNSGAMFGRLGLYKDKTYWENHKIVEFDTLMARKRYIIFAGFYSADYDEHEEGFRYSADIQYKLEADQWLGEIRDNQIYDTGIEAEFGDEFITLTTCDHSRRHNGRFVLVARRIREGEKFE